jgi:hypothetical protein
VHANPCGDINTHKLSAFSPQVSQLSTECASLRRSEARLRGELALEASKVSGLKQRIADLRSELEATKLDLQQYRVYQITDALPEGQLAESQQVPEGWLGARLQELQTARVRQQQLISKLVDRAEAAEVESAALRAELDMFQPASTVMAVPASGPQDYYRQMLVREAELRTSRYAAAAPAAGGVCARCPRSSPPCTAHLNSSRLHAELYFWCSTVPTPKLIIQHHVTGSVYV